MDQQVFLSKKTLLKSRNWIGNITNIEIYESGDWIISFFRWCNFDDNEMFGDFFFLYIQDMNIYQCFLKIIYI